MSQVIEYSRPPHAPSPTRFKTFNLISELAVAREAVRLSLAFRDLTRLPRGEQSPVVLIPGWKAPEASMGLLRVFLKSRGFDANHWGLGTNHGDPERDSEVLAPRITDIARRNGRPVALVGWSLGGVIAREVARSVPRDVSTVITYGTPVIGGPTYTPAARVYGKTECERIAKKIVALDKQSPIPVPIRAIFTKKDKVVSWPACIDRASSNVKHFEVASTHVSMGFDPDVWSIIVNQLHSLTATCRDEQVA